MPQEYFCFKKGEEKIGFWREAYSLIKNIGEKIMKLNFKIILVCVIILLSVLCFTASFAFEQPNVSEGITMKEQNAPISKKTEVQTIKIEAAEKIIQAKDLIKKTPINVLEKFSQKTYMDWKKITDKDSIQYLFIKENMTICDDGFLRDKNGNIGVALGSYFGKVGTVYEFVLDSGIVLNVVKIEIKADKHTVNGYHHKVDKSIIEFVVEPEAESLKNQLSPNGYIWQGDFNNCPAFNGRIVEIYKIEKI